MENETIITLTADIVSAHVSNNSVAAADIPTLILSVFGALAAAGKPVVEPETKPEPAVSIRSSVKPDAIACLECGRRMKMLKRHLSTDHGMTTAEYKSRWGLNADYPLVAPLYAAKRKELAVKIGLGRKPGAKRKTTRAKKAPAAA
jgi:predicted transcriptional regulator